LSGRLERSGVWGKLKQLVFSVAVLAFVIATFPLVASRYRRRIRELARRYRDRED